MQHRYCVVDFKLSPCSECRLLSFGLFTGVCGLNADVSEHCLFHLNRGVGTYSPMKMDRTKCSETLAFKLQTPVNNPEESIRHSKYGESLKSRTFLTSFFLNTTYVNRPLYVLHNRLYSRVCNSYYHYLNSQQ
jgi:hypothetical protein